MRTIGIGTEKGGYVLARTNGHWDVTGPLFAGWKVTSWLTTATGSHLAGLASNWFGSSIHRSSDLIEWEQVVDGPEYPPDTGLRLNQVWTLHQSERRLYAGVDEAGLFASEDDGVSWDPVPAINRHESRDGWMPGLGGLAAHHVLSSGSRLWVGISAVGVFRSDDDGATFRRADTGVTSVVDSGDGTEPACCVHSIVSDPARPDLIWRQDHSGVYRTTDGGAEWTRIEYGLPARFGFPIARDHASARLFVVPLESDGNRVPVGGQLRVYRSDDDGESWRVAGTGWDDEPTYSVVLRQAMATDGNGGVYLATTSGAVWTTSDAGDTWERLPFTFPRVLSVEVLR